MTPRTRALAAGSALAVLLSPTALAAAVQAPAAQAPPVAGRTAASGGAAAAPAKAVTASAAARRTRVTVTTRRTNVTVGARALVRGRVHPGRAGQDVRLQLLREGRWRTVDVTRTRTGGRYRLTYRTGRTGSWNARVLTRSLRTGALRHRSAGRLNAFRSAAASWYGPGLYGNRLACGGTLGAGTLGVAHKTLPCGTQVTLRYHGRTVRVPVVDRGPFVGGREFDLTAATRAALRFGSTGTVLTTR